MEISISRNYQIFGFDKKNNRAISKSNVKQKKISISKVGLVNPIIVDPDLNILDGQHRFLALKELGMGIPYIINRALLPENVSEINSNVSSWKLWDYIYSYSNISDEYKRLKEAVIKYKKLGVSTVCVLFSDSDNPRIVIAKGVKDGLFKFKDRHDIANYLIDLREHHLSMPTNTAIAIKEIIESCPNFDKERLMNHIKRGVRIPNFNDVKSSRKYISDFYNFRMRSENKIF